jgi:hypothetical protein
MMTESANHGRELRYVQVRTESFLMRISIKT